MCSMLYFSVYLHNFAACEIMDNWQGNTPIRPLRPYASTPLRPCYPHQCLFIFSPCNTSFYCFVSGENYRRKTVKTGHLSFREGSTVTEIALCSLKTASTNIFFVLQQSISVKAIVPFSYTVV